MEPKGTSADFFNSEPFDGPFRELIGSLLYLAVTTRPDILFSVNCLSQLQEKPTVAAWSGCKRILRYLKGTKNVKLVYKKLLHNSNFNIDLYVDADWASDPTDRKSVSGYVLMFCNCPILWCCKKQNCISLSSTEAEIIALSKSLQDLIFYKGVINEISCVNNISIYEDNQSAIKSVTNESACGRLKHLDVKLKYIRETLSNHFINIKYVPSEKQIADIFTKSLPKCKLYNLMCLCSVCSRD